MKEREPVKMPKEYENILRNPPDREREARDVLGEAARELQPGISLGAWRDLTPGHREYWCAVGGDRIIARLAEAGYRIVKFVKLDPEPFNPPPDTGG